MTEKKTKTVSVNIEPQEVLKASPLADLQAVVLGLVTYLQKNQFKNDARHIQIVDFETALQWLNTQK